MDYLDVVEQLDPDVVQRLRRAVETGRWPDGRPLTAEQRRHSLQAVIGWEQRHLPEAQRVGFIDRGSKAASGGARPLRWAEGSPGSDR